MSFEDFVARGRERTGPCIDFDRRFVVSRHRNRRAPSSDRHAEHPRSLEVGEAQDHTVNIEELAPHARLRRARETKGLSIDDLVRATKISRSILLALETRDTAHLPAPVYTKGFAKVYAREVGLEPEAFAAAYLAEFEPAGPVAPERPTLHAPAPRVTGIRLDDDNAKMLATGKTRALGGFVTLACAVGLVLYVWAVNREAAVPPRQVAAPVVESDATPAAAIPTEPDAVAADAAVLAPLTGPIQVELRATGPCWLVATADGVQTLAKLLQQGQEITVTAADAVTLRVGDPATLSYAINGRSGRPLGRAGEPVDVRITRDNFRDLLAAR
jgi:cytoskeleton protein RodZ